MSECLNCGQGIKAVDALCTPCEREGKIRQALSDLLSWFKVAPNAFSASEHLLAGCPSDLAAHIERGRAALACPECKADDDTERRAYMAGNAF